MTAPLTSQRQDKGVRGFELDIHVTFAQELPEAQAIAALRVLEGFRVDLYRPHPQAVSREHPALTHLSVGEPLTIPSARLTGTLQNEDVVRSALAALLGGPARYIEVGLRGFLRSAEGQTEWMPWRRNQVLSRAETAQVSFEAGVRYVLE